MIALDRDTLLNAAQQLEARCDPAFIAQEIRTLVANAKPATDPEIVAELVREVRSYSKCRTKIHSDEKCECRHCRLLAKFPVHQPSQEKS